MSIICGTDLSTASAGALEVAVALAKLRGDREIILAHIVDPALGSAAAREKAADKLRPELEAQAEVHRSGIRPPASAPKPAPASPPPDDGPAIRTVLVDGPPDETLTRLAETEGADLIVVAARSTSTSLLRLGATAGRIITRTSVPVILVRDPEPWLAFARGERRLRVMLGIDDSATCDLGIQWTKALRALGPVEVVLGAIYYPDEAAEHYGLDRGGGMVDRDPEIERLMGRDLLRRFGETEGVTARPRRGLGRIGDHMVELAGEEKTDVVVVGTSQKTGLGKLGSVSSVIVDDAPQSVVCVPPQAKVVQRSVPSVRAALVATDMSQFSNRAVPWAFAVVDPDPACEVHIVHFLKDDGDDDDDRELERRLAALAPTGAVQKVFAHVLRGDDAAITVAQCAARVGVDIICIASHGRSGITRALVGSVADRLLRATRLPVLVLRPA